MNTSLIENTPILQNPNLKLLVTDVQLKDGSETQVLTFFSADLIGWEEVFVGVRKTLEYTDDVNLMKCKLHAVKNGQLSSGTMKIDDTKITKQRPSYV
jgi:hypothetical protein